MPRWGRCLLWGYGLQIPGGIMFAVDGLDGDGPGAVALMGLLVAGLGIWVVLIGVIAVAVRMGVADAMQALGSVPVTVRGAAGSLGMRSTAPSVPTAVPEAATTAPPRPRGLGGPPEAASDVPDDSDPKWLPVGNMVGRPSGWYPDPKKPREQQRYWSGKAWQAGVRQLGGPVEREP